MIYLGNPCSPAVVAAMTAGQLGMIDTPYQSKVTPVLAAHAGGAAWCADNGCYTNRWTAASWWSWLERNAHHASTCLFATAPDVVGDAAATLQASLPWLARIRALGYPVAYVAQNGWAEHPPPWDLIDVVFLGGDDGFKLGPDGRQAAADALAHGKRVHMGRVNSGKRWRYAEAIGCHSVDGTYLTYGPDKNLPRLMSWQDQPALVQ